MDSIYYEIWSSVIPMYQKARPADVAHIQWLMSVTPGICKSEGLNPGIMMPFVILHDIGYSRVKSRNPFQKNIREKHMKEGAVLGRRILADIGYDPNIADRIGYYISVHDMWALGQNDIFRKDIYLGVFNDLDFLWMFTPEGFKSIGRMMDLDNEEALKFLLNNEKFENRPLCTASTTALFDQLKQHLSENSGSSPLI